MERTVRYASFSHWAIMTRPMEKTDSEIHSFSHRTIITRTMERTDSEIYSFSHWAIITRAMERTDSENQSFSHWTIVAGDLCYFLFRKRSLFTVLRHPTKSECITNRFMQHFGHRAWTANKRSVLYSSMITCCFRLYSICYCVRVRTFLDSSFRLRSWAI